MKKLTFLPILLLLLGCATPYQKLGDTGGYLQQKLAEDVYRITFRGNGFTDYKRANDFALLRAAEIGKKLGYSYLSVEGEEDYYRTTIVDTGSTSYSSGSAYGYGNSASYYGTTTTYNNQMPIIKPGVILVAKYFQGTPEGKHLEVHNIEEIICSMTTKYKLTLNP